MKISVFGGSNPQPGSETYDTAYTLGKYLGTAGLTVMTGGYMGTMEATSKGAHEAGGHVIGVTCDEIESFRPIGHNQWVHEEWRTKTLQERIEVLVNECDAAIALPGGVGTLLEVGMTWNMLIINAINPKPLILIGNGWQKTMETFFKELGDYIPSYSKEFVAFAPTPKTAYTFLEKCLDLNTQNKQ
jgi:uncharacterized protein (TIGR00730 family)